MTASNLTIAPTTSETMSSLELVDYINSGREAHALAKGLPFPCKGHVKLLHKNFMVKIETHPGIQPAKFSAGYLDTKGETRKCYNLPEREARLMVMAESLEVQTKVLDKLMAMERTTQAVGNSRDAEVGKRLKSAIRMEDYDSAEELGRALDKIDFAPASLATGLPVAVLRRKAAGRLAVTQMLDHMVRGEHEHESPVRNVVEWARATTVTEDAEAKMLAYQRDRAGQPKTLEQIDAYDMVHKHDKFRGCK